VQINVLASGSTGNATLFDFGKTKILVDAGISTRRIEKGLAGIGIRVGEIDGVLITHEHTDHIKGLDVLIRRYRLPVYARGNTWDRIPCRDKLPAECRIEMKDIFDLGAVKIESFSISHDAIDPVGFCFYHRQGKYVMATDLGTVTEAVERALEMSDAAVLESNHDLKMLNEGPYPFFLKKRVRGQEGHLSNVDAGKLLSRISRKNKMQVFLAHLSQQNNYPELAEKTVKQILLQNNCDVERELILHRTYPDAIASLTSQ